MTQENKLGITKPLPTKAEWGEMVRFSNQALDENLTPDEI